MVERHSIQHQPDVRFMSKKIAFTANTAWCLYNFRSAPILGLIREGYSLSIYAPRDVYTPKLEDIGCTVTDLPIDSRGTNPITDFKTFLDYVRLFRRDRPDLVFNYTIKSVIYGSMAAKWLGIRNIAVVSGLGYTFINDDWRSAVSKRLYHWALRYPNEIWFLNHDDFGVFKDQGLIKGRTVRVLDGEGVDTEHFAPRERQPADGPVTFLMISRLYWDKGVREYVEAAAIVKQRYPEARFHILGPLGDVSPSAVTPEQVKDWESKGWISHLGSTTDVRPYIADSDCIVLPSYREGLSRSLMEAASMARPILTTDVVGCREVVDHEVNGFLCRAMDSADLADQMVRFLELGAEARREMGEAGRRKVLARFDVRDVVGMYQERVNALMSGD